MKSIILKAGTLLSLTFMLSGCLYGQCMNGPCALEHSAILKSIKPTGAHWIKDGMTKESRLDDTVACGSGRTEYVLFSDEEIKAAKQPEDPNDIKAEGRVYKVWASCMRDKGYVYLEHCDERCQYP